MRKLTAIFCLTLTVLLGYAWINTPTKYSSEWSKLESKKLDKYVEIFFPRMEKEDYDPAQIKICNEFDKDVEYWNLGGLSLRQGANISKWCVELRLRTKGQNPKFNFIKYLELEKFNVNFINVWVPNQGVGPISWLEKSSIIFPEIRTDKNCEINLKILFDNRIILNTDNLTCSYIHKKLNNITGVYNDNYNREAFYIESILYPDVNSDNFNDLVITVGYDGGGTVPDAIYRFVVTSFKKGLYVNLDYYNDFEPMYVDTQSYRDGKRDGAWVRYFSNGQLWWNGTYKGGKKDDPWVELNEDGTVDGEYTGTFKDGVKVK